MPEEIPSPPERPLEIKQGDILVIKPGATTTSEYSGMVIPVIRPEKSRVVLYIDGATIYAAELTPDPDKPGNPREAAIVLQDIADLPANVFQKKTGEMSLEQILRCLEKGCDWSSKAQPGMKSVLEMATREREEEIRKKWNPIR